MVNLGANFALYKSTATSRVWHCLKGALPSEFVAGKGVRLSEVEISRLS